MTNREQPPPGAFSCECMHTQARYSRFWMCVRVCVCVRARRGFATAWEEVRSSFGLPQSFLRLFFLLPCLFPSLFVSTRDEGCTHRVVLLEVWGFFFFELVVWRILECCCRLCECLRVFFLGVRRREMR